MSRPNQTRLTLKASPKTVQRRQATESTPEHLTFTYDTDNNILLTLHQDPDEYYRSTDHLHAARVEELLTVHENEVNEALEACHDALREVGAQLSAIRAGIRKRFRTSTGTPAIEDFGNDGGRPALTIAPGGTGNCIRCGDECINETIHGVPEDRLTCFTCMGSDDPARAPGPSDEAIDGGNEEE